MSTNGSLFIVAAPSGCGKTSLIKTLIDKTQNICVSISHTTRKPRVGEIHGKNYFFISKEEFDQIDNDDGFIESAQVFDNYYGSAKQTVQDLLANGKDVILEIDWQGARQVKEAFSEVIGIFIIPPSVETLKERLTDRGQDDSTIVNRRMQDAVSEMRHYDEFDYLVVNDDFNLALDDLSSIIHAQHLSVQQQINQHQNLLKALIK